MRRVRPSSEGTTTSTMSFGVSGPDMGRVLSLALTRRASYPAKPTTNQGSLPAVRGGSGGVRWFPPTLIQSTKIGGNALEALAVVWAPVRAPARAAEGRRVLLGFAVVALYAALQLVIAVVGILDGTTASVFDPGNFTGLPPEFVESFSRGGQIITIVYAVLSPFIGWAVVSLLMQLVTRFFGGTGPLSGIFATVGAATVPLVILSVIELPATGLQAIMGSKSPGAMLIGILVDLLVIAAAFARRVGYGESAGSCAISCAGCAGLIILMFVVIIAVVAAIAGVLNSIGTT